MERFTNAAFSFEVTDTPAAGRGGPEGVAILLHGFPQDRRCWDRVTSALAGGGYRVLAPDLRGYSPRGPASRPVRVPELPAGGRRARPGRRGRNRTVPPGRARLGRRPGRRGALVLGPGSPQLLISSASGASVARALEQAAEVSQGAGQPVRVVDLHPLPPGDPQGLVSFYVTIAASLIGFVTMFQLRGNAAGLSLRG